MIRSFFVLSLLLVLTSAEAADFYVDPVSGSMSNNGSQGAPWSTMQGVLDNCKVHSRSYKTPWNTTVPETIVEKCPSGVVEPGDTIWLMSGYQGSLTVQGWLNEGNITVKAYPGQVPTFRNIYILGSSYWTFDGLTVSPEFATPFVKFANGIVQIEKHANVGPNDHITIKNSTIYSVNDNEASWDTYQEWYDNASRAIVSNGHYCTFENNTIRNASGCIALSASNNVTIKDNFCNYMSGDAFGISDTDDLLIEGNTITNIIPAGEVIEDTHPDMMQFSSDAGNPSLPMYRITIRGNYVNSMVEINDHPLVGGNAQGISLLDGMIEDSTVENNIIVVNSPHGSSWYGMRNSKIINNTLAWNYEGPEWAGTSYIWASYIRVYDSKFWPNEQGVSSPSYGNIIRNNICTQIGIEGDAATKDNNIESVVLADHFVNNATFNYNLKPTSAAINAGSTAGAPLVDYYRRGRDSQPDIGAVEYGAGGRRLSLAGSLIKLAEPGP